MRGITAPATVVPIGSALSTVSTAIFSAVAAPSAGTCLTETAIARMTSSRPVRVGFTPTPVIVTRASRTRAPATSRNAADEMSPGTCTLVARRGAG